MFGIFYLTNGIESSGRFRCVVVSNNSRIKMPLLALGDSAKIKTNEVTSNFKSTPTECVCPLRNCGRGRTKGNIGITKMRPRSLTEATSSTIRTGSAMFVHTSVEPSSIVLYTINSIFLSIESVRRLPYSNKYYGVKSVVIQSNES